MKCNADKLDPTPLFVITDCWCYVCKRHGKGYSNLNVPVRKVDSRRPAICSRCATAIVNSANVAEQGTLFDDWDKPEANSRGQKG